MRDHRDNCVVVCSIENFDPMGVHTGDSITVAPAQTLSDVEYQAMRDDAFACIRRVGVETGGSNIQFAVDPRTGEQLVIEMNPRVSRSSALASKATGFPIAKIAARLAVGYRLDEIVNDITKATPASFEPTIDYVVTKVPRWTFEKFPGTKAVLGTQMQSVGEAMAIGRTFPESLQKALRGLEQGRLGLNADPRGRSPRRRAMTSCWPCGDADARRARSRSRRRCGAASASSRSPRRRRSTRGSSTRSPRSSTGAPSLDDDWPADERRIDDRTPRDWRRLKRLRVLRRADRLPAPGATSTTCARRASSAGVVPTFKTVDTCGAEFAAQTPYYYSTYEDEDEVEPGSRPRVVIFGSGPNRIGQGIEFDYCCVHASLALREAGYETVMVNCNPETVSTDYDTSDRLYFEPITEEDVLGVIDAERRAGGRVAGVIVGLGGQTPLKLAGRLPAELVLGTSAASIDLAEDRERWNGLCARLEIPQPAGGTARGLAEALGVVGRIGYPALVRPSYVLGGRAMEIVYDDEGLKAAMATLAGFGGDGRRRPVRSGGRADSPPSGRCSSTDSSRTPSRWMSTPCATAPGRCSSAG